MSRAQDETLDIVVRQEGDYVVLEFIDAKCHCQREECYSTGYIRLTPQESQAHTASYSQKEVDFSPLRTEGVL
jgi:hypothetical protein